MCLLSAHKASRTLSETTGIPFVQGKNYMQTLFCCVITGVTAIIAFATPLQQEFKQFSRLAKSVSWITGLPQMLFTLKLTAKHRLLNLNMTF